MLVSVFEGGRLGRLGGVGEGFLGVLGAFLGGVLRRLWGVLGPSWPSDFNIIINIMHQTFYP